MGIHYQDIALKSILKESLILSVKYALPFIEQISIDWLCVKLSGSQKEDDSIHPVISSALTKA